MKTSTTLITMLALLSVLPGGYAEGCCATTNLSAVRAGAATTEPVPDKSIYQVGSSWTTDAGSRIKLSALAGKPRVVAMFFASCQFTCPVTVNDMKRIEAALPPAPRAKVGFTLVSFDSRRDQPDALRKYRDRHQLAPADWTLLRGEPDDVLELAALLGVNFKQDARGDFAHSNLIIVLNARGEVVHRLVGLNQDVSETVRLLTNLAAN